MDEGGVIEEFHHALLGARAGRHSGLCPIVESLMSEGYSESASLRSTEGAKIPWNPL